MKQNEKSVELPSIREKKIHFLTHNVMVKVRVCYLIVAKIYLLCL